MQSGCRFQNIWRVLAVAGTVGAASAALASGPVKTPDQKTLNSSSPTVVAPAQALKGPETTKVEFNKYFQKGPEDFSQPPVLRGPGPVNGTCATAEPIAIPSSTLGDTTGGVPDPEGGVVCITGAGAGSAGVWYTFTGNGSDLQLTTCNAATTFDTVLRVFSGNCGGLTCVTGNDDNCGAFTFRSTVTFNAAAGTTYYVYVSGFGTASGAFQLDMIDLGAPPPGPANDECATAINLACNSSVTADNSLATIGGTDPLSSCRFGGGQGAGTIWYTFTATETSARLQTCNSSAPADDSIIEVFSACGGFSIGCSEDDCNGLLSRLDLQGLTVGQQYVVQLSSYLDADRGPYNLELVCPVPAVLPGDECSSAFPLGPIPATVSNDTSLFTVDAGLPACGVGAASPSIWYSMTGTGGIIQATTCNGTAYDSALAIFTGDCGALTCIANNDDACGLQSTVPFLSNAGQTYYIVVRGFGSSAGAFTLDVTDLGPPAPGDACSTAVALAVPGSVAGDTSTATPDSGLPACGVGAASRSLWYMITGTGNAIRATTCNGTSYDSALSIFTGDCSFLTCVASNDDACGLQSNIVFPTVAGQTYYIVVRGFGTSFGAFTLDVSEILPPANDECVDAIALLCNSSVTADNLGATDNFVDDIYLCRVGGGNGVGSIWYSFQATETSALLETCTSLAPADDSILQVFEGSCGALIPLPDGCNDDGCSGLRSRLIVNNLVVGNTYYVMLSGWAAGDAGAYTLDLTCPAPPPPPGDDCANAVDFGVVPGSVNGDTSSAFPDAVDTCGGPGAAAPGVWYSVTAPAGATRLRASTCTGTAYDSVIRVYNGPCEALTCVGFNDDRCGLQSEFQWDVVGGQQYFVYVGGFGAGAGAFTLTIDEPPPPCMVDATGTTPEGEADCVSLNGGCNTDPANPPYSTLACNQPIFGTAQFDGFTRDTDWYTFTLTEPTEVTLTVSAEFAALIGFLETTTPNPTGACAEFTGFVNPFAFPAGDCTDVSVTATLGAGVWTAFCAPQFLDTFMCGASNGDYRLVLTGCGGDDTDCNNNGIPDSQEIAGGARDCFNPLVVAVPGTMGGADTFLDECQCVANWNRDGGVNSNDISAYLTSWLNAVGGGAANADVDCSGSSNSNDISAFLTTWLNAVQNTIPHDGCP